MPYIAAVEIDNVPVGADDASVGKIAKAIIDVLRDPKGGLLPHATTANVGFMPTRISSPFLGIATPLAITVRLRVPINDLAVRIAAAATKIQDRVKRETGHREVLVDVCSWQRIADMA